MHVHASNSWSIMEQKKILPNNHNNLLSNFQNLEKI